MLASRLDASYEDASLMFPKESTMLTTRKVLLSLVFSLSVALSGCGGGKDATPVASPAITPGNCAAGSVYSNQYGCMALAGCEQQPGTAMYNGTCVPVGNSVMTNCQTQPGQAPSVYTTQYGCLPQGNCPAGQGSYIVGNTNQCIPGQMNTGVMPASSGCAYDQVMTEKGCLPQANCPFGSGFFQGRCISGSNPMISIEDDSEDDSIYTESDNSDYVYTRSTRTVRYKTCTPKIKVRRRMIKYKYPRNCR
jgi:hypothetical protein